MVFTVVTVRYCSYSASLFVIVHHSSVIIVSLHCYPLFLCTVYTLYSLDACACFELVYIRTSAIEGLLLDSPMCVSNRGCIYSKYGLTARRIGELIDYTVRNFGLLMVRYYTRIKS